MEAVFGIAEAENSCNDSKGYEPLYSAGKLRFGPKFRRRKGDDYNGSEE